MATARQLGERRFPFECMTTRRPKVWEDCRNLLRYYTDVMKGMDTELDKLCIVPSIISDLHYVGDDLREHITSKEVTDAMKLVSDAMKLKKSEYWEEASDYNRLSMEFELLKTCLENKKAARNKI